MATLAKTIVVSIPAGQYCPVCAGTLADVHSHRVKASEAVKIEMPDPQKIKPSADLTAYNRQLEEEQLFHVTGRFPYRGGHCH
jgi:hypothetical protein